MDKQTVRYYCVPHALADALNKYSQDIIHMYHDNDGINIMADIDVPFHPLSISLMGCQITQDDYWSAYCRENPLLHITGTPKIVNGEPMVSLQFLSKNLTDILRATGPISLKNGSYIDIQSDQTISIVNISTAFVTNIKQEMSINKFKTIQKILRDSKDIIIHAYDEALRCNHKILNAKYELKI